MDTPNLGGLRFVVAGSGGDLAEVVLFELPQADQKISSGLAVVQGNFQMIRVAGLANLLGQRNGVDIAFRSEKDGALHHVLQFAELSLPSSEKRRNSSLRAAAHSF